MYEKLFKSLCKELDVERIEDNWKNVVLHISKEKSKTIDGTKIFLAVQDYKDKIKLKYLGGSIQIIFDKLGYKDQSYFEMLDNYLSKIV